MGGDEDGKASEYSGIDPGLFRHVRMVAKSAYWLHDVRLSVRLSTSISAVPSVRISIKFDGGDFYENVLPLSRVRPLSSTSLCIYETICPNLKLSLFLAFLVY